MAATHQLDLSCARIEGGVEDGGEQFGGVVVGEIGVGLQDRSRQVGVFAQVDTDQRLGDAGEQGGRHSFAADVAHADGHASVIQRHEFEPIAAHVARRVHRGGDVDAGVGRKDPGLRQERLLNDRRARHLVAALPSQKELLGHAPKGMTEVRKVGERIA